METIKIDLSLQDNQVYHKKTNKLLHFEESFMSIDETLARYFLENTKLDLSQFKNNEVIRLEGRRIHNNTDDWFNIATKKIEHWQGSSSSRPKIYGMSTYSGSNAEHAILTKAIFELKKQTVNIAIADKKFFVGFLSAKYCNPDELVCKEFEEGLIERLDEEQIASRKPGSGYFNDLGYAFKYTDNKENYTDINYLIDLIKVNNCEIKIF